jgi:hypothetical protein
MSDERLLIASSGHEDVRAEHLCLIAREHIGQPCADDQHTDDDPQPREQSRSNQPPLRPSWHGHSGSQRILRSPWLNPADFSLREKLGGVT